MRFEGGSRTDPRPIELCKQGDSGGEPHAKVASEGCFFPGAAMVSEDALARRDHADTGLVTFGVYDYSNGGKAIVSSAKMTPQALRVGQAVTRVAYRDAQDFGLSKKSWRLDATRAKGPMSPPRDRSPGGNAPGRLAALLPLPRWSAMEAKETE